MVTETFANLPSTTVSSGGTDAPSGGSPETWTVASSSSFPAAATGVTQFHVSDPAGPSEIMAVTNVSGTTWTVTRGAESTTPVTHLAGFTVKQVVTAGVLGAFFQATDPTASDIQPAGVRAAGSVGLPADAGHVHQNYADLSLWLAPTGATGETFPRTLGQSYFSGLASTVVYMSAIPLPGGLKVSNITMQVGGSAFTTVDVTHGWYALTDSSRIVRAVSADQTSGNWGSTFTQVTLPVTSGGTYTTTYGGLYYVALSITFTGGSGEFPALPAVVGNVNSIAPTLSGTASSPCSPPSLGGTLSSITYVGADRFYAYTS